MIIDKHGMNVLQWISDNPVSSIVWIPQNMRPNTRTRIILRSNNNFKKREVSENIWLMLRQYIEPGFHPYDLFKLTAKAGFLLEGLGN